MVGAAAGASEQHYYDEGQALTTEEDAAAAQKAELRRQQDRDDDVLDQKEVAFYSQAVAAWFTTTMELDKSYLTFSMAAIGIWITLITTLKSGLFVSPFSVAFCMGSLIAFGVTCLLVLHIFHHNRQVILEIVTAEPGSAPGPTNEKIRGLDVKVRWCFGAGIAMLLLFGIVTTARFLTFRNVPMVNNDSDNTPFVSNDKPSLESFVDAHAMRPQRKDGLQGVPQAKAPGPSATAPTQPGGASSTGGGTNKK